MQVATIHEEVVFGQTDECVLRAHTELMRAVINEQSPTLTTRLLSRQLHALSGVDRCTVYVRVAGSPNEVLRVTAAPDGVAHLATEHVPISCVASVWCGSDDEPVVINDVEASKDARDLVARAGMTGVRSVLIVPLTLGSERIGLVLLGNLELQVESNLEGIRNVSAFLRLATHAICLAEQTLARRRDLETSDTQKVALQRISGLVDNLERLLSAGAPLSAFVNEAARAVNRRVWVLDPNGRTRASTEAGPGPDLAEWLDGKGAKSSVVIRRGLAAARRGHSQVLEPQPALGLPLRILIVPIMIGSDHWGTLVTAEHGRRFTRVDGRLLSKAATYIALSHTSDSVGAASTRDIRTALALDLLRGTDPLDRLARRAAREHIAPTQSFVVCLVSTGPNTAKAVLSAMLERVEMAFQHHVGDSATVLGCTVPEGLAVLVPLTTQKDLATVPTVAASVVLGDGFGSATVVALSDWAEAIGDLPRAYSEARQVLRCANRYRSDGRPSIMGAADLGVGAVLLASSDVTETRAFAHEILGRLLEQPGADELIRTLHVFLSNSRRVRKCAQVLSVHENTVRYRLGRIDRVCGLNLMTDSTHQSKVELALLVLRLTGACSWNLLEDGTHEGEDLAPAAAAAL